MSTPLLDDTITRLVMSIVVGEGVCGVWGVVRVCCNNTLVLFLWCDALGAAVAW